MKRLFAMMCLASLATAGLTDSASADGPPRPPKVRRVWTVKKDARPADPRSIREVKSALCATTERAEADIHRQLAADVSNWLADDGVARDWTPPKRLVDRMIAGKIYVEPVSVKDLTVFRATVAADFSPSRKHELVEMYRRQVGGRRLFTLGGILAFILACLAAVSGYIRADEATKGYYTNRLRMLAAAGVGAAGVVVYQVLT